MDGVSLTGRHNDQRGVAFASHFRQCIGRMHRGLAAIIGLVPALAGADGPPVGYRPPAAADDPTQCRLLDVSMVPAAHADNPTPPQIVAWLEDTSGAERYVLRVREIATGQDLDVRASDLKWTIAWAADGETLFLTGSDAASRPARALRIRIGEHEPVVVFEEPDEAFFVSVSLTHDERYVLIGSQSKTAQVHERIVSLNDNGSIAMAGCSTKRCPPVAGE